MRALIQQVHIYLGLLSFSSLCVFGLVGLHATFEPKFEDRAKPTPKQWEAPFATPKDLDDVALAEKIRLQFAPPIASPIAQQFLKHDPAGRLVLDFYDMNGLTRVTVFDNKLTIEQTRVPVLEYLNRIHATTTRTPAQDFRVRAWVWYNELAVWSLIGMTLTGLFLWRRTQRAGLVAALLGAALFALVYWRLQ